MVLEPLVARLVVPRLVGVAVRRLGLLLALSSVPRLVGVVRSELPSVPWLAALRWAWHLVVRLAAIPWVRPLVVSLAVPKAEALDLQLLLLPADEQAQLPWLELFGAGLDAVCLLVVLVQEH